MAHFAQLDKSGFVIQTVVVSNADIIDDDGRENENKGIQFCNVLIGEGPWVQTSYNGNFRKCMALPGYKYDSNADVFYDPNSPHVGWVLDKNFDWAPPWPPPDFEFVYEWDDNTGDWSRVYTQIYSEDTVHLADPLSAIVFPED